MDIYVVCIIILIIFIAKEYSSVRIYIIFIHSSVDGHLGFLFI
jgi:hypothetical protein